MLATGQRQLEEGACRLGQPVCTAWQEVHLTAAAARPRLNARQPDAHPFALKFLRDFPRPKPATAFGAWLFCKLDHRFCPRLDGVTHHGRCGM